MRKIKTIVFALVLFVVLAMSGLSFSQSATDEAKEAGHDTKQAAKHTGRAVKKGTKKAAHATAKETRKGAEKVENKTE